MVNRYVGAGQKLMDFVIKKIPKKKKVSPTIKSVKPTKDLKGSVKRTKSAEYSKRIDATTKSKGKIDTGKKMMREGQKELRKMIDTKRAFKFKYGTTKEKTFPIEPGRNPKKEHKNLVEEKSTKKFKTAKQMEAEKRNKSSKDFFETQVEKRQKKMGGGMMGRRFGYKTGLLVGKQTKIDVAPPFNKITSEDFKKLRKGKKSITQRTRGKTQPPEDLMRDRMKQPLKRNKP